MKDVAWIVAEAFLFKDRDGGLFSCCLPYAEACETKRIAMYELKRLIKDRMVQKFAAESEPTADGKISPQTKKKIEEETKKVIDGISNCGSKLNPGLVCHWCPDDREAYWHVYKTKVRLS